MDFAIFTIAFNIGKRFNRNRKAKKTAKTGSKNQPVGLWGITVVEIKITATQKICRCPSQCLIQAAQIPSFSLIEKMKAALFEQPRFSDVFSLCPFLFLFNGIQIRTVWW
jgi:hypothetical protein